ncbi:ATP-binding protein [Botrimarina sp.]|uniref:sensor histidine kinase n=1 Tax=Botrimarina sp. TaxID=2795802 RepID=UPI0032F0361C
MSSPAAHPAIAWLARPSVSSKIALGFGTVLVLHLTVVALGHYGLRRAQSDRVAQEALRSKVETFNEVDRTLAELQRNVLLFEFTGYTGPEHRAEALEGRLRQLLDEVEDCFSPGSGLGLDPELLTRLRGGLRRHHETFQAVVLKRAERQRLLEDTLAGEAQRFLDLIGRLGAGAEEDPRLLRVQNAFAAARLHTLRFVADPYSSHVRVAKQSLADARRWLAKAAPEFPRRSADLLDAIDRYESAFTQMVQSTRGYLRLANVVLAGESEWLLQMTREARVECAQRTHELSQQVEADADRFIAMNTAVSVITVLLGLGASWLIARNVAPPLKAIAATFDRLAADQPCGAVPCLGRGDELGRLAHAAEAFRAKAAETQRLLNEITRLREHDRQVAHSRRMESIGQLAAGIAHEVNTPMQAAVNNVGYISTASRRVLDEVAALQQACQSPNAGRPRWRAAVRRRAEDPQLTHAVAEMPVAIDELRGAVGRVVEIVGAMRVMAHPGRVAKAPIDVNQLVRDAAVLSSNRWKEHSVCEFELGDSLPMPEGAAAAISQAVLNLIVNAADAIAEARAAGRHDLPGVIRLCTYADADSVYIEVADTGPGVPEAIRERIFDPFFTTKDIGQGTGQGLALCYDVVVRQHRGELTLVDHPGRGATFLVRIPIEAADAFEPAPATASVVAASQPTTT